jgi:hypothetical protein
MNSAFCRNVPSHGFENTLSQVLCQHLINTHTQKWLVVEKTFEVSKLMEYDMELPCDDSCDVTRTH